MVLILTMAGRYARFTKEGYKLPKYLLPWGDKTILSKILTEMKRGNAFSEVLLIGNIRDEAYLPHIHATLRTHHIQSKNLTLIPDTKGQAETALAGLQHLEKLVPAPNGPVVFGNIDTILYNRDFNQAKAALTTYDGYVDVFSSSNHNYSYVLTEEGMGVVQEIAEKTVISNIATSGLYGFSSPAKFRDNYSVPDDIYITSVYKKLIAGGGRVVIGRKFDENETVVLGTPVEYMNASITATKEQF